jgi:hypothetical protein
VRLYDEEGVMEDKVCYENATPWPESANGLGHTLSLINAYSNNESVTNWEASLSHGTPGQKNTDVITGILETLALSNPSITVYPNPVKKDIGIEIVCEENENINMQLLDLTGRRIGSLFNKNLYPGKNQFELSLEGADYFISPGVYIMHFHSETIDKQIRIVIN